MDDHTINAEAQPQFKLAEGAPFAYPRLNEKGNMTNVCELCGEDVFASEKHRVVAEQ